MEPKAAADDESDSAAGEFVQRRGEFGGIKTFRRGEAFVGGGAHEAVPQFHSVDFERGGEQLFHRISPGAG